MDATSVTGDIEITHMPYLDDAFEAADNWTGVTDPKERRKRQNRLHQRAWRRRQAAQRVSKNGDAALSGAHSMQLVMRVTPPQIHKTSRPPPGLQTQFAESSQSAGASCSNKAVVPVLTTSFPLPTSKQGRRYTPSPRLSSSIKDLHAIFIFASEHRPISSLLLSDVFPLSADHRLITLIQYNVMRGLYTNTIILCLLDQIEWDCGYGLNLVPLSYKPTTWPPNFEPTHIQKTVDHGTWIDIIPFPQLRDNLILQYGKFDNDGLCDDMVGGLYEGFDDVEVRGIMLWGEPWSEDGWEVTEGFLERWGFLLKGCHSLMDATNRWREARGEGKLVF